MSLLVACLCVLPLGPKPPSPKLKAQIVAKVGSELRADAFVPGVDFSRWDAAASAHKAAIDAAATTDDFVDALNDAVKDLGVSHLAVLPPDRNFGAKVETPGFVAEESGSGYVVTRVFDGTDAQRRGLHRGTFVKELSWKDANHLDVLYLDDAGLTWEAVLRTERTALKTAPTLTALGPDAFVLSVPEFSVGYDARLVDGLMAKATRAPYLVLDLRGNSGGQPPRLDHLLGYFLPAGTRVGAIVQKEALKGQAIDHAFTPEERAAVVAKVEGFDAIVAGAAPARYPGHVAVLIDSDTGSAAEIAARGLREYAGLPIFGAPSAGMVVAATAEKLPGGYQLVFPYADYWTARGERLEGNPVVPDYPAKPGSEEASANPAPLRLGALRWLRAKYPSSE